LDWDGMIIHLRLVMTLPCLH